MLLLQPLGATDHRCAGRKRPPDLVVLSLCGCGFASVAVQSFSFFCAHSILKARTKVLRSAEKGEEGGERGKAVIDADRCSASRPRRRSASRRTHAPTAPRSNKSNRTFVVNGVDGIEPAAFALRDWRTVAHRSQSIDWFLNFAVVTPTTR